METSRGCPPGRPRLRQRHRGDDAEPLLVLDGDLRVRSANPSFYRNFEVAPDETEGRLLYDLGDRQWAIPRLRTLLEDLLPRHTSFDGFEVEHDFPTIGRKVMVLNARLIPREGNHAGLILLAIEDITERRRAEEARREAETRFTSLVKNVKDHAIFSLDADGRVTSWNVAARGVMGYTEEEALGQNFSFIFTPEDIAAGLPEQELRSAREDGRAEDERWHVRKGGGRFWALGIVTPMHDETGRLTGYSKVLRDMDERKRAEDLLGRQAAALEEAHRRKDEFLATLAHELRNPLAAIRNALLLMGHAARSDSDREAERAMAGRQVAHLARLIEDLMDVARIAQGKIELQREVVELARVVSQAVETARPQIDERRHRLTVSVVEEPIRLEGDPTRLEQILWNLLNNAAKYSGPGGAIDLIAEAAGGEAVVRVRDTGIGIAPEMLPKVFDMFVQVGDHREHAQGGLGIGLCLVRTLVELHGGSIAARSEGPGTGSEFVVRLPVLPE